MEKVIYLKDIIKQAKKEYEQYLKNIKTWKEWNYYRNYLWYLVYERLSNEINEIWKNNEVAYVKYRNKLIRLPVNLRWDYKERCLIFHFAYIIDQIEYKIRDKYYVVLEKKIGKFKEAWE